MILHIVELIFIGVFIYKGFSVKSYLEKKGEHLAKKEDIQELTSIVKGVENELNLLMETEISLMHEEKNAIIEIITTLTQWEILVRSVDYNIQSEDIRSELEKQKMRMTEASYRFNETMAKFQLFISEERLHELCNRCHEKLIQFEGIKSSAMIEFVLVSKLTEIYKENEEKKLELNEKAKKITVEFYEKSQGIRRDYFKLKNEFVAGCRQYLHSKLSIR